MGQYNSMGIEKRKAKNMVFSNELEEGGLARDTMLTAQKQEDAFWNTKLDEELSWIRKESRLLSYGEIGIIFTIHDGKIVRTQQHTARSVKM